MLEKKTEITSSAISRIPSSAWNRIFDFAVNSSYADHRLASRGTQTYPFVYTLAQVCQTWRSVVHENPTLWNWAYAPSSMLWEKKYYDIFVKTMQLANGPINILTNLSRQNLNGTTSPSQVTPDERTSLNNRPYTLHVHMEDDVSDLEALNSVPFTQPSAIVFSSISPLKHPNLVGVVQKHRSNSVKSLTIINDHPRHLQDVYMPGWFPGLTSLRLSFKSFPPDFSSSLGYLARNYRSFIFMPTSRCKLPP